MDKKESLAFLQSCIDSIDAASDEEIVLLQEAYTANCILPLENSAFEFIPPTDKDGCLVETSEEMKIPDLECNLDVPKEQWNYNMQGVSTNNQQSDESFPYAA
jgi:hypothetical protein